MPCWFAVQSGLDTRSYEARSLSRHAPAQQTFRSHRPPPMDGRTPAQASTVVIPFRLLHATRCRFDGGTYAGGQASGTGWPDLTSSTSVIASTNSS
eukprot:3199-Eustigmatos_ZCMA.PRE.1